MKYKIEKISEHVYFLSATASGGSGDPYGCQQALLEGLKELAKDGKRIKKTEPLLGGSGRISITAALIVYVE